MTDLFVLDTSGTNPYHNLAVEEYLLDTLPADWILLYLWRNEKSVVIGRNQCAGHEVNLDRLRQDGCHLVRRLSGGGAVYHDPGNLNFTFLCANEQYDVKKQTEVILQAIRKLGLDAQLSGRNDLTIQGRKFSGHAYYHARNNSFHHGTLMIDVDMSALSSYLRVSEKKLAHKHVASVRSRVINLKEIDASIGLEKLKTKMIEAFAEIYAGNVTMLEEKQLDQEMIGKLEKKFADPKWIFRNEKEYEHLKEAVFDWGFVNVFYDLQDDVITDIAIYTDSLQTDLLDGFCERLKGSRLDRTLPEYAENKEQSDVAELLLRKEKL